MLTVLSKLVSRCWFQTWTIMVYYPNIKRPNTPNYDYIDYRNSSQIHPEPITTKHTESCRNSLFRVSASCMQGWRANMEDSHTHILSLTDDPASAYFAVYDGHGGAKVAEYASKHLHKYITKRAEYKKGHVVEAMKRAFLELDEVMRTEESLRQEPAGTTAVTMIIKGSKLYCANVGDSRAVASIHGKVNALSFDHKPYIQKECDRIITAGGWIEDNRVNGNLALSRALGDFMFKRNDKIKPEDQIVTAYPDVEVRTITPEWEFIVLACDGIWDVMTNEEVVAFVRENIAAGSDPEEICESLMMHCLAPDCQMAGLGCDNMTVVIICLLQGKSYEDLVTRCASPADDTPLNQDDAIDIK